MTVEEETFLEWLRAMLEKNLDKFLLLSAFYGMLLMVLHAVHHQVDKDAVSWMRELAGQFAAAFLTLVTSQYVQRRNGNGNGTPPPPPGPGAQNGGQPGAASPTATTEAPKPPQE